MPSRPHQRVRRRARPPPGRGLSSCTRSAFRKGRARPRARGPRPVARAADLLRSGSSSSPARILHRDCVTNAGRLLRPPRAFWALAVAARGRPAPAFGTKASLAVGATPRSAATRAIGSARRAARSPAHPPGRHLFAEFRELGAIELAVAIGIERHRPLDELLGRGRPAPFPAGASGRTTSRTTGRPAFRRLCQGDGSRE